jgi:hypothetical protein
MVKPDYMRLASPLAMCATIMGSDMLAPEWGKRVVMAIFALMRCKYCRLHRVGARAKGAQIGPVWVRFMSFCHLCRPDDAKQARNKGVASCAPAWCI